MHAFPSKNVFANINSALAHHYSGGSIIMKEHLMLVLQLENRNIAVFNLLLGIPFSAAMNLFLKEGIQIDERAYIYIYIYINVYLRQEKKALYSLFKKSNYFFQRIMHV